MSRTPWQRLRTILWLLLSLLICGNSDRNNVTVIVSCDIHTHAPAPESFTNFLLYHLILQKCSTNCLGHGHGHEPDPRQLRPISVPRSWISEGLNRAESWFQGGGLPRPRRESPRNVRVDEVSSNIWESPSSVRVGEVSAGVVKIITTIISYWVCVGVIRLMLAIIIVYINTKYVL